MPLRFYNTLSQQVEEFRPAADNTVRMYTCGPTVYDYAHIGNFRTFIFVDLLRRWLRASGFQLDHVMNITDVDDKIIRNAVGATQITRRVHRASTRRLSATIARLLRLETPEQLVPATEHIPEMVQAIERLAAERPYLPERRLRLFPHRHVSRIRQAVAQRFQRQPRRRARGCGQVRKGRRARFRPVEGPQGRRDRSGNQPSARAARAGTSNAP